MEPRYLLDTNICIYIRQQQAGASLAAIPQACVPGEAAHFGDHVWRTALRRGQECCSRTAALERLRELVRLLPALALPESGCRNCTERCVPKLEVEGRDDWQQ